MYESLIQRLDNFIRRYYKNLLIKGTLFCIGLWVTFFLVINLLEYFGNFNTSVRTILFYCYLAVFIFLFVKYILITLLKYFRLGKTISHEQAAKIIGDHFPEVQDKLLNVLQLNQNLIDSTEANDLVEASINQKVKQLSFVSFDKAIDISKNKKYIKYVIAPVLLFIVLFIVSPSFIIEPSKRIIYHQTYFEKPAPFSFVITNKKLETAQNEDFNLSVKIKGDELPSEVFINVGKNKYKLNQDSKIEFSYLFKNIQASQEFYLEAGEVRSPSYTLKTLPKPILVDFTVRLDYPKYLNKESEVLFNIGDLIVPKGTTATWSIITRDTRSVTFSEGDNKLQKVEIKDNPTVTFRKSLATNFDYSIFSENEFIASKDTLKYSISVIDDAYPSIQAMEQRDSLFVSRVFFKGVIKDDYGFSKLGFYLNRSNTDDTTRNKRLEFDVPFDKTIDQQEFYYQVDLQELGINPGDQITYYFEVWDNDGVNGAKSARSQSFFIGVPTLKELDKELDKTNEQIKDEAEKQIAELKKLQKEITEISRKLLEKKELGWQDKQQIEKLLEKQKAVKSSVENMLKQMEQNSIREKQFKQLDEELVKKQEELEKMFNELLTDDMKKMMEEMQKLAEQNMDKDKMREMLEKMQLKNEDIEKQLDRDLELFKQLELEKKMTESIDKMRDLAEKQDELAKETENSKTANEDLKNKQEKLNEEFKNLSEELKDISKKNKELEEPTKFERKESSEKSIMQKMENSKENLDKNSTKKAADNQKKAAEEMEDLAKNMEQQMEEAQEQELAEDIEEIRQMLKNLVRVSFEQENLMNEVGKTSIKDPKYTDLIFNQKKIKDDLVMIEDSIFALSKRQMQIRPIVNKEIATINDNVEKALEDLLRMNTVAYITTSSNAGAKQRQQYAMTSMNNLALLLAESLSDLQNKQRNNQSQKNKGSKKQGSCSNPGSSGKSQQAKSMKQLQEALNKQLEQMKNGMKPDSKGKMQPGEEMSEQLARMAAQQEKIRRMMQQYGEEIKKDGNGKLNAEINQLMNEMEQTETDLVNRVINSQTINRQEKILTRLLEYEKAEMKREQEEKRESNEAKNKNYETQTAFEEYNRMKKKELEIFRKTPPAFTPFYKSKVNEYFLKFED